MAFELGQISKRTPHLLADTAELILLVRMNGDSTLHKSSFESIISSSGVVPEDLEYENISHLSDAERNDESDVIYEDCWAQFEYRSGAFGEDYPFEVGKRSITIKDNLNAPQRLYCFLLCVSRLRSFTNRQIINKWAGYFAQASRHAMRALLPAFATVHIFDANSDDRKHIYGTDRREALIQLGFKLGANVDEEACREGSPSGDNGIDLVGFLNFEDGAIGALSLLGQCAAKEKEWPSKRLEAHPMSLRMCFQFSADPTNVMFIPVCFRKTSGSWAMANHTSGCLLVDRLRFMKLLKLRDAHDEMVQEPWLQDFENTLADHYQPAIA